MSRVFLVRHGQTDWNATARLQGATDIPLNDVGRAQARVVATALARVVGDNARVVSSPLSRAADTALQIAAALKADVDLDPDLAERSYGVWEGTMQADRVTEHPAEVRRWAEGHEPRVDGYEPQSALTVRMSAAIERACQHEGADTVVVSHGSALRAGICTLAGLPATPFYARGVLSGLGNAHWAVMSHRVHGWSIESYNVAPTEG